MRGLSLLVPSLFVALSTMLADLTPLIVSAIHLDHLLSWSVSQQPAGVGTQGRKTPPMIISDHIEYHLLPPNYAESNFRFAVLSNYAPRLNLHSLPIDSGWGIW